MPLQALKSNTLQTVRHAIAYFVECDLVANLSWALNADYAERLSIGSDKAQEVVSEVVGKLLARQSSQTLPKFSYCPYLNMSICPATSQLVNGPVPVVAYNPLAWTRTFNFRIPVPVKDVIGTACMHPRDSMDTLLSFFYFFRSRSPSGGEHQGGDCHAGCEQR
jgi:hypothetical protein